MAQEVPTKHGGRKVLQVTSQRTGWKILLILCLLHGSSMTPPSRRPHLRWLQASSLPFQAPPLRISIKHIFPLLVAREFLHSSKHTERPEAGVWETGGTVTIQCHYVPSSVNRHQRKYWCRLEPPSWICHTIVSTNHYVHRDYHGRVALTDFPHSGLFVVRLFRLSLGDVGHYRCGIGDRNNMLFLSMNLTVLAGPSSTIQAVSSAPGEFVTTLFGIASTPVNKRTSGATQFLKGRGTEWGRAVPSTGTSEITPSVQGRQTPRTARTTVLGTSAKEVSSGKPTVPTPESPATEHRTTSSTSQGVWVWGTRSSVTVRASTSEGVKKKTTPEAERPQEGREVRTSPGTARKSTVTTKPSSLISEHVAWETLPGETVVSKQRALYSTEESSLAPGALAYSTTHVEGSIDGHLENTPGENSPPSRPSQLPAAGLTWALGNGSSMKSVFPEKESSSWPLTSVVTALALVLLATLVLLQRRIWRKRTCPSSTIHAASSAPALEEEGAPRVTLIQMTYFLEPTLLPDQLPNVGENLPPAQASLTVLEDPGP